MGGTPRRGNVRIVGVVVVQEGKERSIPPPSPQPVAKGVVKSARIAGFVLWFHLRP